MVKLLCIYLQNPTEIPYKMNVSHNLLFKRNKQLLNGLNHHMIQIIDTIERLITSFNQFLYNLFPIKNLESWTSGWANKVGLEYLRSL